MRCRRRRGRQRNRKETRRTQRRLRKTLSRTHLIRRPLAAEHFNVAKQVVRFALRLAVMPLPCNPFDRVRRESEIPRLGIDIAAVAIQLSAGVVTLAYLGDVAARSAYDGLIVMFKRVVHFVHRIPVVPLSLAYPDSITNPPVGRRLRSSLASPV
jgi:hypothetical protein